MERRVRGNSHVRCEAGEKTEIASKSYLSLSIFGFLKTSPEFIINFDQFWPGDTVKEFFLTKNRRSTPEVLEFANRYAHFNDGDRVDKDLIPARESGKPVTVKGFSSDKDEYEYIVKGIVAHLEAGVKPEDIAVIAYTKNELRRIMDLLTKEGIPSKFCAPESLQENPRVRGIMALARVCKNSHSTMDAAIVANCILRGHLMEMKDEAADCIDEIVELSHEIEKAPTLELKKELFMECVDSFILDDEAATNFKEKLDQKDYDQILQYCEDFSVFGENATYRRQKDYPGVTLVTAHSGKGLEWKVVYNTISRYGKAGMRKGEILEGRRLLFVSATRARDELYITGTFKVKGGTKDEPALNMFLSEAYEAAGQDFGLAMFESEAAASASKKSKAPRRSGRKSA